MPRHPTVQVPNIGPMDHAWDLLGEWQAEFELPEAESPVHGKVMFRSWTDAELQLDPVEAAIAGIPSSVPLERASEIHLTDAGGGALQWVLHAPSTNWSLQATLWPGSLHLFVHDADDDEEQLYRARRHPGSGVLPAKVSVRGQVIRLLPATPVTICDGRFVGTSRTAALPQRNRIRTRSCTRRSPRRTRPLPHAFVQRDGDRGRRGVAVSHDVVVDLIVPEAEVLLHDFRDPEIGLVRQEQGKICRALPGRGEDRPHRFRHPHHGVAKHLPSIHLQELPSRLQLFA